jgi:ABC-2 type transport system ATP-binding protein
MSAIQTRALTRRFGKLTAVDQLDLQIPSGELFGLIGPNGAGKTTTLRMLAGLLEPSQGDILIHGQKANHDWRDLQSQIGFMPDFFGVYEDLLVWEYLDFFARCYGLPAERRARVTDELLDLVDLYEKRDDYVQTLSRGMRQRLCLAHALVHDPQVLLLDEPASGLDPRARVEMRELLRELKAMGKTIVLSSHILAELAELCDSVGILEKGILVASGSLEDIRRQAHQDKILRIKVLSNPVEAETLLLDQPGVTQVYPIDEPLGDGSGDGLGTEPPEDDQVQTKNPLRSNGHLLEVEFQGDAAATADLLEALITHKVRVASLGEVGTDLEEIFLRLTRGEVA